MKPTLLTFLFLGLAATQDLPIDQYEDAQDGLVLGSAPFGTDNATLVVDNKRSEPTACVDQVGNGPHVDPDTDTAFLAYPAFSKSAVAAAASPPQDYEASEGWIDLKGSNGDNTGYLGYVQSELTSYDPGYCASLCSAWSGATCSSFVIYYERDPELVWPTTGAPSAEYCPAAADSASVTLIKCAFYSVPLYSGNATNVGQYQGDFHLVVAGSTAFNVMSAPVCDGFTGPVDLGNAVLNIPAPVILYGYLSIEIFPNTAFDPNLCATQCKETSAWNLAHGIDIECTSFDAYVLYRNGVHG